MCATIIGTPRNSYEENETEVCSIYILLFKADQSVLKLSSSNP